jgi:hypothetical protein
MHFEIGSSIMKFWNNRFLKIHAASGIFPCKIFILLLASAFIFLKMMPFPLNSVLTQIDTTATHKNSKNIKFGRPVTNNAFQLGENLHFRIRYGAIVAGSSRMGVDDTVRVDGNLCYKIVTEAFSSGFFSKFFKVEDRVISYADREGLFTWYFEQHLREGRYKADRWSRYNQRANLVYTYRNDTLKTPPYVNDVLSSFYYVRTQPLMVGDTVYVQNHADRKVYPLAVIIHRKEKIEVKAGRFRCLVVEPVVKEGGLFKHEGKLTIWFSDDEKKIPVQMKSKVSILGSITAELADIEGVDETKLARW